MRCLKHDFPWDISNPMGCPICYGESLAAERLLEVVDKLTESCETAEAVEKLNKLKQSLKS